MHSITAEMKKWGSPKEIETRRRIRLALWAHAYEDRMHSIVSDAVFDRESYAVDLSIETDRLDLDYWFRAHFDPCTGSWIHKHPEYYKIVCLYNRLYPRDMSKPLEYTHEKYYLVQDTPANNILSAIMRGDI